MRSISRCETTRQNYPSLVVPFHSRWRHFVCNGEDRWAALDKAANWRDAAAQARAAFDLAIVSVLLDAGAGPQWRYHDAATGRSIGRSEGLALASLVDVRPRRFSRQNPAIRFGRTPKRSSPLRSAVGDGLQVSNANPLVGMDGRVDLLRRLGALVAAKTDIFGRNDSPRPGGLFDHLAALAG